MLREDELSADGAGSGEQEGGGTAENDGMAALAVDYIEDRCSRGELSRDTARNDRSILAGFVDTVACAVDELTEQVVESWLGRIAHLAPATRRGRFSVVKSFCRWLCRRGHLASDPTLNVQSPKQPRSVPRALPHPAVTALLDVCPDARARLLVTLMVQEGLRCCEVSRLQVGDLDRLSGMMRVVGKGGHQRVLPITAEAEDAIDEYLSEYPARAGALIRSYRKPSCPLLSDTISGLVGGWCEEAGIKRAKRDGVSAHALRHTAATDMLRGGAHVRDVQHALGHAHLATTEVYLPYLVGSLGKAMGGRTYGRELPEAQAGDGAA